MKFALLVPTYNEATSIVELLDSLSTLRETGTYQFDVLVIDDNSPDATAEIFSSARRKMVLVTPIEPDFLPF